MKAKKQTKKQAEEFDLDAYFEESKVDRSLNAGNLKIYIPMAAAAILPMLYLYTSIFHLNVQDYYLIFLGVSVIHIGMLCYSYNVISHWISDNGQMIYKDIFHNKKIATPASHLLSNQAMALSIAYNNALFLFFALLFAFFLLNFLEGYLNCIAALCSAAGMVTYAATAARPTS